MRRALRSVGVRVREAIVSDSERICERGNRYVSECYIELQFKIAFQYL